jgi:hypothetical protein
MIKEVDEGRKRFLLPQYANSSWEALFDTSDQYAWTMKKFATKLKQMVCLLTGCTMEDLENPYFKDQPLPAGWMIGLMSQLEGNTRLTYRQLLQQLGSKIREIHEDAWVNGLFTDYEHPQTRARFNLLGMEQRPLDFVEDEEYPTHSRWLVTDMRYPNELARIQMLGGIVVRISAGINYVEKNGYEERVRNVWTPDGMKEVPTDEADSHSSETALDKFKLWDFYVKNTGSLIDLYAQARQFVEQFNLHL